MVNHLLSVKPDEPLASRILQDFETYMTGFVSLPLNIPGTGYARAVKVILYLYKFRVIILSGLRCQTMNLDHNPTRMN